MAHNVHSHSGIEEVTFKPAPLIATGGTGSEWLKYGVLAGAGILSSKPLTILSARCNRGLFFGQVRSIKCDGLLTELKFRCAMPFGRG